ncbi:hypothetical protein EVAR_68334_1 [Eumeta japonica]|uniref:Uncharacterized protein n=1 Tax=Eumeta variegata TaxID=151549 RepID=A0A4C1SS31_EUMVA|nr:hypothetical protein EVAR_68334_1 [Eumeta japonica]
MRTADRGIKLACLTQLSLRKEIAAPNLSEGIIEEDEDIAREKYHKKRSEGPSVEGHDENGLKKFAQQPCTLPLRSVELKLRLSDNKCRSMTSESESMLWPRSSLEENLKVTI